MLSSPQTVSFFPPSFPSFLPFVSFLFCNYKKKIAVERVEKIEYENGVLLEKMKRIVTKSPNGREMEFKPGVRLNRNQVVIESVEVFHHCIHTIILIPFFFFFCKLYLGANA